MSTEENSVGQVDNSGETTLSVVDIQNALAIIDAAVERKTFGGWNEILQVKGVRDRLATFVEAINPPATQLPEPVTVPTPEEKPAKVSKKNKKQ